MNTGPSPTGEELVTTAGEREMLEAFIDSHRVVIPDMLRGLSEQDVRRRLVPSLTTLAGLVKHAAAVERSWFQRRLAQRPPEEFTGYAFGDDESWHVGPEETIADLLAEYEAACAESRRIAAGFALDDIVPHDRLGPVSLRWIYVHLIRELARHAGHGDILREQIEAESRP